MINEEKPPNGLSIASKMLGIVTGLVTLCMSVSAEPYPLYGGAANVHSPQTGYVNGNTMLGDGSLSNFTYDFTCVGDTCDQWFWTYTGSAGNNNTAIGQGALSLCSNDNNTAVGFGTLAVNNGDRNTAVGAGALASSQGNNNTAVGYNAGKDNAGGSNNIYIGSKGNNEDNTIRIGGNTNGVIAQTDCYIAGIYGTQVEDNFVVGVAPDGHLGSVDISNLEGPQGPQGPAGEEGPQGAPGVAGATGPAGPRGATGAVGPQGAAGAPGKDVPVGTIIELPTAQSTPAKYSKIGTTVLGYTNAQGKTVTLRLNVFRKTVP